MTARGYKASNFSDLQKVYGKDGKHTVGHKYTCYKCKRPKQFKGAYAFGKDRVHPVWVDYDEGFANLCDQCWRKVLAFIGVPPNVIRTLRHSFLDKSRRGG